MKAIPGKKFLTPQQALERMRKYCALQERSQQEVRYKLVQLGQRGNTLENIIATLIEENFLNEERYAMAFARGKFRMKGWGKAKIIHALKQQGISAYCISKAMKEIDQGDYRNMLMATLKKKAATLKSREPLAQRQLLARYLIGKGFEAEMVWEAVKEMNEY